MLAYAFRISYLQTWSKMMKRHILFCFRSVSICMTFCLPKTAYHFIISLSCPVHNSYFKFFHFYCRLYPLDLFFWQPAPEHSGYILHFDRLGCKIIHAGGKKFLLYALYGVRGQRNYRHVLAQAAWLHAQLPAASDNTHPAGCGFF